MATCKAFLKDKNKGGEYKVWVKYTHKSEWKPFSTGITIKPEHFDSNDGRVLETHSSHYQYNAIIHALSSHLSSLASSLESKFIIPTPTQVRLAYDQKPFIHNRRTRKKLEENNAIAAAAAAASATGTPPKTPFDWNRLKTMPLQEFQKTDLSQSDFSTLMRKHGTPSMHEGKDGTKSFGYELTGYELMKILTPQFKSDKTRESYFDFELLANEYINGADIEESTRKQRKSWLTTILDFSLRADVPLSWEDFDKDFYDKYANWLMFGKEKGINNNDLYNNSFGSHVKRLCSFLEWIETEVGKKVNSKYKKFKVLTEEKEIVYLDPQEINMLWEFNMPVIEGYDHKKWRIIQDICVFGSLTGLRISDIKRSRFNLEILKRDSVLEAKTKKTKRDYFVPVELDPRIELILKKYEYNLNIVPEQEFNKLVKIVLYYLYQENNIHQKPIKLYKYKLKKEYEFEKFKHELFTSHCNRRSAVTNWHYNHGFSETEILLMLGSKSITELKKYISKNPYKVQASVLQKIREQNH